MLHSTPRSSFPRERDNDVPFREPDYISFIDISRFFRRYFFTISGCFLLLVAAAVFFIYTAQHKFTARAQILIDPYTTQILRDPTAGSDRSLDTAQVEGQIAVLRSETLAFSVIERLKLTADSEFRAAPQSNSRRMMDRIKALIGYGEPASTAPPPPPTEHERLRTALDVFEGNLDVRRVGPSYAIDVAYTSTDPDKAALIANAVADSYIQDQLKAMSRAAQQSSEWLEARLTQLRTQLNASARQLELFKSGRDFRIPGQRQDVEGRDAPAAPQPGASDIGARDKPASGGHRDTDMRDPAAVRGEITLAELESTTESYRKTYEAYQQAFTEAVQRQSFPLSNTRVITAAAKPLGKSSPRGRLILAFAGLAGLLLGVGIAFLRQSMDHTIRSARQVAAKIGVPCLALLPRLGKSRRLARPAPPAGSQGGKQANKKGAFSSAPPGKPGELPPHYDFRLAIDVPFSPFTSGLKTLRTAIANADPRHPVRCVGITSGMPREGKSMIAGNLATLYALSPGRTLIIDADIHNSTVSRYFAPGMPVGLLEVVTGVADLDKAIVKGSGFVPDILPIAVKESAPVSYEQLISEKMETLLRTLRERYEMIIVDLPPVHPIIDGVAIASLLDGVVIAAEWGRTPLELLAEVTATLHTARVNLLGVVITKADASAATIRWRKDWGYGYYPLPDKSRERVRTP
jgi:capsular exopolysaccharide synthesis family protein